MDENLVFNVFQKDGLTKFENHSEYHLFLYAKPVKPKRKYKKIILIPRGSFKVFDMKEDKIDLTTVVFSLEKAICDT